MADLKRGSSVGGYPIWHGGNHGASSGLDADTVDGIESARIIFGDNSYGSTNWSTGVDNIVKTGYYYVSTVLTNLPLANNSYVVHEGYSVDTQYAKQTCMAYNSNRMFIRTKQTGTWGSWWEVWNSANDGTGSGMDADTLDGKHATDFAPFSTLTATTPATIGWYRIATSAVNIGSNSGTFKVDFTGTGVMGRVYFLASSQNGADTATGINQLGFTSTNYTLGLTKVRVVYHSSTPTANYAYMEVYNPTALAITYSVDLLNTTGWSLVTPSTAGSIPGGYSNKELTCDVGMYSFENITTDKQIRSKIAIGTKPLDVTSTTVCTNLNADMLDGLHAPTGAIVGISDTQTLTNKTLTSPKIGTNILDTNDNEMLILTPVVSAVNEVTISNSITATNPVITASGGDTNIGINLVTKGTGTVNINGKKVIDSSNFSVGTTAPATPTTNTIWIDIN